MQSASEMRHTTRSLKRLKEVQASTEKIYESVNFLETDCQDLTRNFKEYTKKSLILAQDER